LTSAPNPSAWLLSAGILIPKSLLPALLFSGLGNFDLLFGNKAYQSLLANMSHNQFGHITGFCTAVIVLICGIDFSSKATEIFPSTAELLLG
jgi:hypothetical protein